MTENKPIIINRVDVRMCKYAIPTMASFKCGIDWENCNELDCYFKQLARKTQECEQAEQKLERIRQMLKKGAKIHDDIVVNKSILQIIEEIENEFTTEN